MDNDYNYPLDPINKLDLSGKLSADSAEKYAKNGYAITAGSGGIKASKGSNAPSISSVFPSLPGPVNKQVKLFASGFGDASIVLTALTLPAMLLGPEVSLAVLAVASETGSISTGLYCLAGPSTPNCLVGAGFSAVGLGFLGHFGRHVPDGIRAASIGWEVLGNSSGIATQFSESLETWFDTPLF
ncbi:hypothetical protein ITJ46_10820 [Rathayibacter sp. VKM Ac-2878]|nr:hypothetical protein [Rathayibacter sp. VKM Ac-2879]MBF4504425.1 hypothetical protein [Rathayibacter sp. VKM Ac-2878]